MNCATGQLVTMFMGGEDPEIATIEGKFQILAGEIRLGSGKPVTLTSNYSGLVVTEDAELWGGKFKPLINPLTSSEAEHIKTLKKLNIKVAFTITPWYLLDGPPYTGGEWAVLRSQDGFTDGTNPTNGDEGSWTMKRSDDEKAWMVKWKPQ